MADDDHKSSGAQGLREVFIVCGRRPLHGGQAQEYRE